VEFEAMAIVIRQISRMAVLAACGAVLAGCAQVPAETPASGMQPVAVAEETPPVPELNLNLPDSVSEDCQCPVSTAEEPRDLTFLERGYSALAAGDHIEAVKYFQRYQRLESSPESNWEAGVAIAYVSMLPSSPFFDPEAARKSWRRLRKDYPTGKQVHEQSLLMRDSLDAIVALERHIDDLEANNATLKEDLEKREEALKRLRELTLGQRGARQ
jgi:tetratricopeptide (TPR) repeat protein